MPRSRPLPLTVLTLAPLAALLAFALARVALHAWGLPLLSPGAAVLVAVLAAWAALVLEEPRLAGGGAADLRRLGLGVGLLALGEALLYYRVERKDSAAALGFALLGGGALALGPRRSRAVLAVLLVLAAWGVYAAAWPPAGGWDLFGGLQLGQRGLLFFWLGLGALFLALARVAAAPAPALAPERPLARRTELALMGGVLVVGALLRFWQAGQLPQGLWYDEVNLSRAIQDRVLATGDAPLYLGEQVENPGAFLWAGAAVFRLFGVHIGALRVLAGFFGLLAIVPFWALARLWLGGRWALAAAFIFACMRWVLIPQRIAFMSGFALFWMLAAFWALWSAQLRPARGGLPWRWLLAGALLGANLHTYTPARVVPVLALAFLGGQALVDKAWRRSGREWLALGAGFLAVGGPMLGYIALNWHDYLHRAAEVSIFTDVKVSGHALLPELWASATRHALMLQFRGDFNARHNLHFYPQADFLLAAALGLALPWSLGRARHDARARFLWLWLVLMLAAGVLSMPVEAPQGHRCILAAPVLPLMAALALRALLRPFQGAFEGGWPRSLVAAGLALLLGLGALNAAELLGQWPTEEATFRSFSPRASAVMRRIEATGPGTAVLTSLLPKEYQFYGYEWGVFARFALRQQDRSWASLSPSQVVPASDGGLPTDDVLIVWGDSDADITGDFLREFPGTAIERARQPFPGAGEPEDLYLAAQVPWKALPLKPAQGPAPLLYRTQ